jgi:hypothetical protein
MAETDRQARNHHIHRNARLGPRRSVAMTFGIMRVCGPKAVVLGRRNSAAQQTSGQLHAGFRQVG